MGLQSCFLKNVMVACLALVLKTGAEDWHQKNLAITFEILLPQFLADEHVSKGSSGECLDQIRESQADGDAFFRVIDAWGKPEAGLTQGNVFWFGRPSLCNEIQIKVNEETTVTYSDRIVSFQLNTTILGSAIPVNLDACLPEACNADDTNWIVKSLFLTISEALNTTLALENVSTTLADPGLLDFMFYFTVSLFGTLVVIVLVATLFDYSSAYSKECLANRDWVAMKDPTDTMDLDLDDDLQALHQEFSMGSSASRSKFVLHRLFRDLEESLCGLLLNAFSLRANIPMLLSCKSNSASIDCLNGIRVLSINWVVLGHTLLFTGVFFVPISPVDNLFQLLNEYASKWTFLAVSNGTFSVDTFFLLSGFLVTYLCLPRLPGMRRNSGSQVDSLPQQSRLSSDSHILFWTLYIVKRYIRLAPALIFMTLFTVGVWKVLGNGIGAMWQPYEQQVSVCESNWWTNFVFVSNFPNVWTPCNGWTWYLANDFQFYIFSIIPFILFILFKSAIPASLLVFLCISLSAIGSFFFAWIKHIGPTVFVGYQNQPNIPHYQNSFAITFGDYYVKPYFRFGAYGVGLLLGFLSYSCPPGSVKMSKKLNCVGWLVSIALMAGVIFGLSEMLYGYFPSFFLSALYNSTARILWAVGVAWVMFACMHGYGGIINSFLSWKIWIPLARLTYLVYLLHPLMIVFATASSQTQFHYNNYNYAASYVSVLTFTYALAAVAYLLVELPVIKIERALRNRFSASN
ncbi:nose resistant to fluoxetine protein 6-like [Symsagittifera roscoffensis]|uniref:nose resistant to fluoxetine protein 6-like n=1 Tax=Symsagittifera roscoffensis TaxID=84072 RepID=UPI00307BA901